MVTTAPRGSGFEVSTARCNTLDGEARDPTALAVRCMDAAADAFSSMR
jgi:hypothetical protein